MLIKRREHDVPSLNMASMPDLIFTVLFFFMIASNMRTVNPVVSYKTPEGTELSKTLNKQSVIYVYIGTQGKSSSTNIQVNNRVVAPAQLADAFAAEKSKMSASNRRQLSALIKADRNAPMSIIMQVKNALREANVTRVSYGATPRQKVPEQHPR